MRRLPPPVYSARATFDRCVDEVRNQAIADQLRAIAWRLGPAEQEYQTNAAGPTLFGIQNSLAGQPAMRQQMIKLYKNVLSKQGAKLRYIYDELRSAPGEICPLCAQRTVGTLDHYLEKARFPLFAVMPLNLIPACTDCNYARSLVRAQGPGEQTLHPYFDEVDDDHWLLARVQQTDPIVISFEVDAPPTWPQIKAQRMQSHFRVLKLGRLYTAQAASELAGIRAYLLKVLERQGVDALRDYLQEQADSRSIGARNTWQGALYRALASSNWFVSGGMQQIAGP